MKIRSILGPVLVATCLCHFAAGAEPTPPRQPPAPPAPPQPGERPGRAPRDPITFIGLVTNRVPGALAAQLGLPEGFGLIVDSVVPDSPAATGGVQKHDLLKLFGDQKLVSPDQLSTLVRSQPDGADVPLTLVRKGQEMKLTVKLAKRAPEAGGGWPGMRNFLIEGLPAMKDFLPGGDHKRMIIRRPGEGSEGSNRTEIDMDRARMIVRDNDGEIEISRSEGKRTVTVKKADGSLVFSGPIDNEEDRKKMPGDVRERVEKVERKMATEPPPIPPVPPIPPAAPKAGNSTTLEDVEILLDAEGASATPTA